MGTVVATLGTTSLGALDRVEAAGSFAVREVTGDAALDAGHKRVAKPNVRECAADHHLVIPPPRPV